jgi:MFS transporter, DHA2 family, multidrug resistance protein
VVEQVVAKPPLEQLKPSAPPQPDSVVEYGERRLLIVIAVMMAALMQTLDATIVNVALPTIEGNVGASIDDGTWIITGYIITNVIIIPLVPYMLQRLGRRQYYAACVIGFTVASFLCGTATSLGMLVFYRVIQGAFGGGLVATSQIILRDTFPPEKLGASSALFAMALTVGPALGPTLGGVLTDSLSWQWVFDINIVPGTLAAILILTKLRNPVPPKRLPFDATGLALLATGFGSLQYVLDEGNRADWFDDSRIVTLSIVSALALIAFVVWELRGSKHPIVDLRIFRFQNVQVGIPASMMIGTIIFGPIIILPQYVQNILGFTATLSGLLLLMRAWPVMVLTPIVASIATKVDVRWLLGTGLVITAGGFWFISTRMTPQSDYSSLALPLVLSGVGQSFFLVPLLVGILGSLAPNESAKASSLISLSVQLGGSIASAALITIFDRRMYFHSDIYRSSATLSNMALNNVLQMPNALPRISQVIARQAANAGFADAIFVLIGACAVAVVLIGFLARRKATNS